MSGGGCLVSGSRVAKHTPWIFQARRTSDGGEFPNGGSSRFTSSSSGLLKKQDNTWKEKGGMTKNRLGNWEPLFLHKPRPETELVECSRQNVAGCR